MQSASDYPCRRYFVYHPIPNRRELEFFPTLVREPPRAARRRSGGKIAIVF